MEQKRHFPIRRPWLIAWSIIYAIIIIFGLIFPKSFVLSAIKITSIFLCFVYVATSFPNDRLLILALFLTCLADTFLAFNNVSLVGLIIFVAAQVTHLIRFDFERYREALILFSVTAFSMITLVLIFQFTTPLYVVCAFYGVTLTLNLIAAWRWHSDQPKNPHALCALIGFLLFCACDICVGASYLSSVGLLSATLYLPANYLVWCFYYPSQIFISNSAKRSTVKIAPPPQNE